MNRIGNPLGATRLADGSCQFVVWAPRAREVAVRLLDGSQRTLPLEAQEQGYFAGRFPDVSLAARYCYRLDGHRDRPDPASRSQPEGVHGPSQVVEPQAPSTDEGWRGLPLEDYVLYELHVGTFTPEGTFESASAQFDALTELGVTAIELMPIAEFPGRRNWGYDGVFPFAAHHAYGGPRGLRALVDAAHRRGLAVVLDAVYNHLGPEGNCLADFGPYFTSRHRTPWGEAINFDGPGSDEVRRYFIDNALWWLRDLHVDALRLDAIHAMVDQRATPFLAELAAAIRGEPRLSGRFVHLIAESSQNDPRVVRSPERGGLGLDAQWLDDFQRALHALVTGERHGAYADFGRLEHLARAYERGFVLAGEHSAYRGRRHGAAAADVAPQRFVAFAQNHDCVGNRAHSRRLGQLVGWETQKLAAAATILSPYVPLLFMGEEYGDPAPFPFFTSFEDAETAARAESGRQRELADHGFAEEILSPQSDAAFTSARLNHELRDEGLHAALWAYYRALLQLRRSWPAIRRAARDQTRVCTVDEQLLVCERQVGDERVLLLLHFGAAPRRFEPTAQGTAAWELLLDSADAAWYGPGASAPTQWRSGEPLLVGAKTCLCYGSRGAGAQRRTGPPRDGLD